MDTGERCQREKKCQMTLFSLFLSRAFQVTSCNLWSNDKWNLDKINVLKQVNDQQYQILKQTVSFLSITFKRNFEDILLKTKAIIFKIIF